jgi:hypothetical protein
MERHDPAGGPGRFVIEVGDRAESWAAATATRSRVRAAIEVLRDKGTEVRLVRTITDPDDGTLLLVVEARTRATIAELARRADLHVRRVAEVVDVDVSGDPSLPPPERPRTRPTRKEAPT